MDRGNTNQGLKIGLFTLVVLAVLAIAVHKVIEYITPISSSTGYREFVLPENSTNTFAIGFVDLLEEFETRGFDVLEQAVLDPEDPRFEYEKDSAGGMDRLKYVEIRHDTLAGYLLHWTESVEVSGTTLRIGMLRYEVQGADGGDMHFRDFSKMKQVLEEVLELL